jgi:Ca2+:H+ antiporter
MSSKRPTPYRGQEFSVDDDVAEVEQDNAKQQAETSQSSPRINPLRRKTSTLRRRVTTQASTLSRVKSHDGDDNDDEDIRLPEPGPATFGEITSPDDVDAENHEDEDDDVSDAESFTLKDRQEAINETHPFGIRIWKPALYKKNRSVEKTAEGDIHSSPGGRVSRVLFLVNLMWTLFFGWWLALVALLGAVICFFTAFSPNAVDYGRVFLGLSRYLLYPFGSFVRLKTDEHYAEEDEGEGRSISEYEQWQSGDLEHGRLFFGPLNNRSLVGRRRSSIDSTFSENDSLLGRTGRSEARGSNSSKPKRRLFGRGEWSLGRVIFFTFFYLVMGPMMLLVSLVCWLLVFWIPMGRVMNILVDHLRRHPLALSFHSDGTYSRSPSSPSSSILLCTYRAAGTQYWKYTVDGTNIFFINLLSIVVFAIFDYWVLDVTLGIESWLTHPGLIFTLALFSIIPLAYFIGQAVASISAQSSMGLGAAINAFFSTIVEVYLYCVALGEGKAQLVEGSLIGSIFAGILFLPGLSMCFGAIRRKTQRFNVKSAGVTSTMLLFAVIAAFGPTLFYQVYGSVRSIFFSRPLGFAR